MPGNPLVRFDEGRVGRTAKCRLLSYSTVSASKSFLPFLRLLAFPQLAKWAIQRSHNLSDAKIFLPLHSLSGIVPLARPIEPEEACQPIPTKLSQQHFQSIALELFIGHLFDRRHTHRPLSHSTGFMTRTRGEPTPRTARLMHRSSVVSKTSALPASALLKCSASKAP
jgi:hypothetical protein